MLILQVILITAIEGLRVQHKPEEEIKRKIGWLPPESNNSNVKAISFLKVFLFINCQ